jgi:16S rRNA (guanine966-N2)-methyltransferase
MFAGSGALGFEALSRGASHCCFVEKNPAVLRQIQANCELLNATRQSELVLADASVPLQASEPFDIVFLDPPFKSTSLQHCLDWLINSAILKSGALIYVETAKDEPWRNESLDVMREKYAGEVCFRLTQLK